MLVKKTSASTALFHHISLAISFRGVPMQHTVTVVFQLYVCRYVKPYLSASFRVLLNELSRIVQPRRPRATKTVTFTDLLFMRSVVNPT